MWRFRLSTFLALSRPRCSPPDVVSTDWLSTLAEVLGWSGFSAMRAFLRSRSWIVSRVPLYRHSSKYHQTVRLCGKSLREVTPVAAGAEDVEDGVDDVPGIGLAGTPAEVDRDV
jgi:hypothetical protein